MTIAYAGGMHKNSLDLMSLFVTGYLSNYGGESIRILDVGSQGVDADARTYRQLFVEENWQYQGLDIAEGPNVDVCVSDPYVWHEVPSDAFDVVISGQTLEHVPFFWNLVFEVGRVLRPGGLACFIAPSGGHEHRYPVDCWRFYPDGFSALSTWLGFEPLDTFTDWSHYWGDSVVVLKKPTWTIDERQGFEHRWHVAMSLLPGSHTLTNITFEATAETSILETSSQGILNELASHRRTLLGTAFHRLQRAALELLGPRITRGAIDVRNQLRSGKAPTAN